MNSSFQQHARAVDHLVLPVEGLERSRQRHSALGFSVAASARHPFGTENACVFLADGTYLEPLAVGHRETCEAVALKGNVFVARDQAYRFRRGQNGFSAIAFGTADAAGDHKRFTKLGHSAGKLLKFGRIFEDAAGNRDKGEFRLAFAADLRAPDCFLFTCERLNVPKTDRSALEKHLNTVSGISEIAFCETNPTDFQYFLQEVVGQREVNAHSFGMEMRAANANLAVYSPDGMKAWFGSGSNCGHARGLRLKAVVFKAARLDAVRKQLQHSAIDWREHAGRVVIDPAPGQGAIYAFEEVK
ncbi:MAG: VOC family protein [Nitratireductor sp.]|nr:VOC family protein [Nitratireductor sp.]